MAETKSKDKSWLGNTNVFVLIICSVCLVILGSFSAIAYYSYLNALNREIRLNRALATSTARNFEEHEKATIGIIQAYASRRTFRDAVAREDSGETLRQLGQLKGDNREIDLALVTDRAGTLWANLPVYEESHGQDFSHLDWYRGVSAEWKPYVSSVYKQIIGEKNLAVLVCAPVTDERGRVIGILGTAQGTAFLEKILNPMKGGLDARLTLIDQTGNVIVGDGFSNLREITAYPFYPSIREALGKGETDLLIRNPSGGSRMRYVSFAQVEGIGWTVISEKERGQVIRSDLAQLFLLGISALLSCMVAGIALVLLRKEFVHRFAQLEDLRRLATVVSDSNDAVIMHDLEGKILAWNRGAKETYSYTEAEALGMNVRDMVAEPDREAALGLIQRIKQGEIVKSFELRRVTKDGRILDVWLTTTLLTDEKGKPVAIATTERDITERNKAEADHEKLEAQFRQAQKMEAVGRLAGGVAHDFNNMLQVILSYAEMALEKLTPSDVLYAAVQQIIKAGQRSADLTRQLLTFARKQTIAPKVLDLNESVAGMLKMLKRLIGEDIDLAMMVGHDLGKVKMDPSQLDQILANLTVNARDAISSVGKVTIETDNVEFDEKYCRANDSYLPGQYVLLAVSDDGCGMDKETQAKIFEPFFTTKPQGQGTGLGLSTVYGIVKQNNGFINMYSEPGNGTTFKIYLPRLQSDTVAIDETPKHAVALNGTETVLLVDDEEALLGLGKMLLEDRGYTALTARSPIQAIQLAEQYSGVIDLLLTDVVMPGMSGRELFKKLSTQRSGLKCLFMSGYTADAITHRGVLDEGVHFLQKPFSVEQLGVKLREALDQP
ncbi:MAG: PAS domain S-box protein [Spirochaetia bacterium]